MKRNAVALKLCPLIGSVLLWYAGSVRAIPAEQSELLAGTQPLPDFSGVAHQPPRTAAPPVISAGPDTASASREEPGDESAAPASDAEPETSAIPCMISFDDEDSPGETCDDGDTHRTLSVQFGQRMGDAGSQILGEFDGIRVNYRLSGGLTLNGVAGYPVLSDQDRFNSNRQVFGVSANTARIARAWDLNSYLLEQQDSDQVRRNAGGALRYLRPGRSMLLMFDYDMAGRSLDAFTASGALELPRSTTLSATVDVRSSPLRKRQQRYLKQTMESTDGWTLDLPTDRIQHYTGDLSEGITTLSVGLSHTFSSRLKLTGSAAMLDVNRETCLAERPETPSEYFYHLRLTGSDLMFHGTRNVLDLSHRITDTGRTSSATFDTRYAISRRWKVSPRLRTDYRDNITERSVKWVTAPSVKMEYHWRDRYGVKIEAGGEWVSREIYDDASNESSYFVNLGYKASF